MTDFTNSMLYSYEENQKLTHEITNILSENTANYKKIQMLKNLKSTVSTPISQQHVEYYLKKLKSQKIHRILKFISAAVITAYLIFTLFRVYWYFNPEENPFKASKGITVTDLIVFMYVIPVVLVIYFSIRQILKCIHK